MGLSSGALLGLRLPILPLAALLVVLASAQGKAQAQQPTPPWLSPSSQARLTITLTKLHDHLMSHRWRPALDQAAAALKLHPFSGTALAGQIIAAAELGQPALSAAVAQRLGELAEVAEASLNRPDQRRWVAQVMVELQRARQSLGVDVPPEHLVAATAHKNRSLPCQRPQPLATLKQCLTRSWTLIREGEAAQQGLAPALNETAFETALAAVAGTTLLCAARVGPGGQEAHYYVLARQAPEDLWSVVSESSLPAYSEQSKQHDFTAEERPSGATTYWWI